MDNITMENLENLRKGYLENTKLTIARRALSQTKISSLTRVSEQTEFTRNCFSNEVKTMTATNQKSSGRCWIFAGLNVLREKIGKKYNIQSFELSQNYVAFYDKLEKCNYFINSIAELRYCNRNDRTFDLILQNGIQDGGQWDLFVNIVKKYGVVPKDVYPETFQSSNTREINGILNRYLRKTAAKIVRAKDDPNYIDYIKEQAVKEIYQILCSAFGVPPETFSFEYANKNGEYNLVKDITPKRFFEEFVENDLDDYVSIINSPTEDKPFNDTYTIKYLGNVLEGNRVLYLNLDMERFKKLVTEQLKFGELVWFGSDCHFYGDRQEGIWDDKSFDENTLFQIDNYLSKEEMLDFRESAMNHAMVLTGVNIDGEKTTKWKIENSWGDDAAFKGYHVASDSWFDRFVYQAVINKKYLSNYEKDCLKKTPKELELWDPMGTLAD